MFGGSKLCHCEIGTDRIRNKPLMEKGYKLPPAPFGDHGNLAGSGGEEPRFTSDLRWFSKSGTQQQGLSCVMALMKSHIFIVSDVSPSALAQWGSSPRRRGCRASAEVLGDGQHRGKRAFY